MKGTSTITRRKSVRLRCDGCGAVRQGLPGQSIDVLRLALRKAGWRSNSTTDLDRCPTCVASR